MPRVKDLEWESDGYNRFVAKLLTVDALRYEVRFLPYFLWVWDFTTSAETPNFELWLDGESGFSSAEEAKEAANAHYKAEIEKLLEPVGWQPIETAPVNTMIQLWAANGFGHKHVKTGMKNPANYPDLSIVSVYEDGESLGFKIEEYAKYWLPLPPTPEGEI